MMRLATSALVTSLAAFSVYAHPGHDMPTTRSVSAWETMAAANAKNEVTIEVRGEYRYITSNGIPDHAPGRFPNRGNPNSISEQKYTYRVPATPKANDEPTPMRGVVGVALNGVPMDPGTAEFWSTRGQTRDRSSGWNYDALSGKIDLGLDASNAHVQPNGAYHYHGIPTGLVEIRKQAQSAPAMVLVGYAGDGFPIYADVAYEDPNDLSSPLKRMKPSYRLKEGNRPESPDGPGGRYDGTFVQDFEYVAELGDLDECNGRFGLTPEYPDGTYYYMLTTDYPFIPRLYRGTPDASFIRRGPGGPGGPDDANEQRPRGPIDGRPAGRPPRGDGPPPPPPGVRPPRP